MSRQPPPARDRSDRSRLSRSGPRSSRPSGRDRNRKKADLAALARLLIVLAFVGEALRITFASPRLRLQEIRISGSTRFTPEEVTRLGGIGLGQNIFQVNLVRVSRRLMEAPAIREAEVVRELPNALRIELSERDPALLILSQRDGRSSVFCADREGVVFSPQEHLTRPLPVLELSPASLPEPGRSLRPALAEAVWECLRLAREERLNLHKLRVDGSGELWLNIETYPSNRSSGGSLPVRVGRSTDLPAKFRDIRQALLGWPDLVANAAYLNVVSAGSPAYMRLPESRTTR